MAKDKTQAAPVADKPAKPAAAKPAAAKAGKGKEETAAPGTSLSGRIASAKEFFEQSKVELKKVTWPTKQETVRTGVAVLVFSVIMLYALTAIKDKKEAA